MLSKGIFDYVLMPMSKKSTNNLFLSSGPHIYIIFSHKSKKKCLLNPGNSYYKNTCF